MPSGPSRFYFLFFEADECLDRLFWTEKIPPLKPTVSSNFFQGREANLYTEFKKAWSPSQLTGSGWNNSVRLTYSLSWKKRNLMVQSYLGNSPVAYLLPRQQTTNKDSLRWCNPNLRSVKQSGPTVTAVPAALLSCCWKKKLHFLPRRTLLFEMIMF